MDNESYNDVNMAGSLFGAASQMGATMYGFIKLDDFARGTKIVEQAKHTASLTGKTLTEVAGDVRFNLNLPFSGKLDGKFGKKTTEIFKGVGWSNSYEALNNSSAMSPHSIQSAFKANNKDMLKIFKEAGASEDEIKSITNVLNKKSSGSKLSNFFGSKGAYSGSIDDVGKHILKEKGVNLTDDVGKEFLGAMEKYGSKLKGSPHLIGKEGIGLSINLTTMAKASPKLFSALGKVARLANIAGQAYFVYDIAKSTGDAIIDSNKNSIKRKRMEENKILRENGMSYEQSTSMNETVMNRRIEGSYQASLERSILKEALSAGNKVNELMRTSLGGFSDSLNVTSIYR